MEWLIVTAASLLAGFIDAIVVGGGLVWAPALCATFPGTPPATLFGNNEAASLWGTAFASWQYSGRVPLRRFQQLARALWLHFAGLGLWP